MTSRRPSDPYSTNNPVNSPVNDSIHDGVHTRRATSDETAYRDGYARGRVSEQQVQQIQYERERASENNGIASGVILGILLTALAGLGIVMYSYSTRTDETPVPAASPAAPLPTVQPQTAPPNQTTIIERTREVVPVIPEISPPQVNIEVPPVAPAQPQDTTTAPANSSKDATRGDAPAPAAP